MHSLSVFIRPVFLVGGGWLAVSGVARIHHLGMENAELLGELAPLMADATIEEIWINSPTRIYVARAGRAELTPLVMSTQRVTELVERLLLHSHRRVDLTHPFVDATLPDGSRLHVAIPTVTAKHWAINIRKHLVKAHSLADLEKRGVISPDQTAQLLSLIMEGKSILVSGGTHTGKTTMLNALLSESPPDNRVITIEEVFELDPDVRDLVALQTREATHGGEGAIDLRRLVKEALRMRPSRIVVGEVRGAEALDLLIALNAGIPGAASIHANSAEEAIEKLRLLPLLAGENLPLNFINSLIGRVIDAVVHLEIDAESGDRFVSEIMSIDWRDGSMQYSHRRRRPQVS